MLSIILIVEGRSKDSEKSAELGGCSYSGVASEVINELVRRKKEAWRVILRTSTRTGARGCDIESGLPPELPTPLWLALGEALRV